MAAGKGKRWNDYLGISKQEAKINDENLLERTVRLIKNMILRHLEICFLNIKMVIIHKELLCLSIN